MRVGFLMAPLLICACAANATPLNSWNLNLGVLGGGNATNISTMTLNGFSELDQTIAGNSALGQGFTFGGSLGWVQYQQNGAVTPSTLGLPAGYTDLYLRFTGLTGTIDGSGNASFNSGIGQATLYLDNAGTLLPSMNALTLASFTLTSPSTASDVAYYDGYGLNPMYSLSFQLGSALTGLFTDGNGIPILPQAIFSIDIDGLLDPSILVNPTPVANGSGVSVSALINAGQISAINIPAGQVPEPATSALVGAGLAVLLARRFKKKAASRYSK